MYSINDVSKIKVEAASAFTAVCAYHPWRTSAARAMAGLPFTVNPRHLYADFKPSVIGAHQFFAISTVHNQLAPSCGNVFASLAAGALSAITVAPCDAWAVRKQAKIKLAHVSRATVFRGFTPTVFRQMGLAAGMFVFPSWIEQTHSAYASDLQKERPAKALYAFGGGAAAAILTHYPYSVAVVMQSQQQISALEACQVAFEKTFSRVGFATCCTRLIVVGIAFTTMRFGREQYPKFFTKEEK